MKKYTTNKGIYLNKKEVNDILRKNYPFITNKTNINSYTSGNNVIINLHDMEIKHIKEGVILQEKKVNSGKELIIKKEIFEKLIGLTKPIKYITEYEKIKNECGEEKYEEVFISNIFEEENHWYFFHTKEQEDLNSDCICGLN